MARSRRVVVFWLLAAAGSLAAAATIASALGGGPAATARTALPTARAERRPMIVVRSLDRDRPGSAGQVAVAGLRGERTLTPLTCDRVHFEAGRGICLSRGRGLSAGLSADVRIFGADLRVLHKFQVEGSPSRARVSPDGRYGSVTLFVTGHSYGGRAQSFSTETTLLDMQRGTAIGELEHFAVTRAGRPVTAVDANFWGVTFARDSDRFYATLATGGKTYLVRGSVKDRTLKTIHENVECPSLSPDGTRVAYKKRVGDAPWRLTVLNLATMRETPLAETRSVDDQAEWLDDDRVLYGLDKAIWSVSADGRGQPRQFMALADSPAVVRW